MIIIIIIMIIIIIINYYNIYNNFGGVAAWQNLRFCPGLRPDENYSTCLRLLAKFCQIPSPQEVLAPGPRSGSPRARKRGNFGPPKMNPFRENLKFPHFLVCRACSSERWASEAAAGPKKGWNCRDRWNLTSSPLDRPDRKVPYLTDPENIVKFDKALVSAGPAAARYERISSRSEEGLGLGPKEPS